MGNVLRALTEFQASGVKSKVQGPKSKVQSPKPVGLRFKLKLSDSGLWTLDFGPWTLDFGLTSADYESELLPKLQVSILHCGEQMYQRNGTDH